ncbi:hypothetical protein LUZ63_017399 [Rhynchospora breviuscula]|uniref:KIB1-4 beta-propeller domain-containing protein n=1 Tax=Rhynchospora breviuscula TaxID=2022672 RepID=A0A9Q0HG50_9POAL|nr:hypothetical protein LUZ63_017399 [Rhynchospora breviuscula]
METSPLEFSDWAYLPEGVVNLISEKVKSVTDHVRFRAVCSPWRSASLPKPRHLPPQLPWLIIPWVSRDKNDNGIRLFYDLWEDKMRKLYLPETSGTVCCASYCGWLLLAPSEGIQLLLLNPLTGACIQLPPFATSMRYVGDQSNEPRFDHLWRDPVLGTFMIKKVIFFDDPTNPNCLIAVFLQTCEGFFCCHVGDPFWTRFDCRHLDRFSKFMDATYYNGRFYLLCDRAMEIIEFNKPEQSTVHPFEQDLDYVRMFLLEEKSGVLVVGVRNTEEEAEEEDTPATDDPKEDIVKCPKKKVEVYQYQEAFKLKKVTDASNTIFFCGSGVFPHLTVCSDDWDFLDGDSMYMECIDLSLEGKDRGESSYSIYIAKVDDGMFEPLVSNIMKKPRICPSAHATWFQPSFF